MKSLLLTASLFVSLSASNALAASKKQAQELAQRDLGRELSLRPGDLVEYIIYEGARPQYLEVRVNGQVVQVPGVSSERIKVCAGKGGITPNMRARISGIYTPGKFSTIYGSFMPNFQRVGGTTIGIHGGQDMVGRKGPPVLDTPASHGCIRINNSVQLASLSKDVRRVTGQYPIADIRNSSGTGEWNQRSLASTGKRSRAD